MCWTCIAGLDWVDAECECGTRISYLPSWLSNTFTKCTGCGRHYLPAELKKLPAYPPICSMCGQRHIGDLKGVLC